MTRRVALGNIGGAYGLRVSKTGYDCINDEDEFMLFSSYPTFGQALWQGHIKGTAFVAANTTQNISIPMPAAPVIFVLAKIGGATKYSADSILNGSQVGTGVYGIYVYATATTLTIQNTFGADAEIKYTIFSEIV